MDPSVHRGISSDKIARRLTLLAFMGYNCHMTNTRSLRGILAALIAVLALSACGSNSDPYASYDNSGPYMYCAGPETGPFGRGDMVRYPDEMCAQGALPAGFALVSAPTWNDYPDVGETLLVSPSYGWSRAHRYGSHHTVVVVRNPPRPVVSRVLVTRDPTVGSASVRSVASSRAQAARRVSTAAPAANPNIKRNGFGVPSGQTSADRQVKVSAKTSGTSTTKTGGGSTSSGGGSKSSSRSGR